MARRTTPLTDTEIKKAKPKEKEYSLCDGYGLLLRIKSLTALNYGYLIIYDLFLVQGLI